MKIKSINTIYLPQFVYDILEANPNNNFIIKTNSALIVSHNCNFSDK